MSYSLLKKLTVKREKEKINRQFNEDYIGILDKCSILIECKTMQFEIKFHVHLSVYKDFFHLFLLVGG